MKRFSGLYFAAAIVMSTPAWAEPARLGFTIRGVVRTICRVELAQTSATDDGVLQAQMSELCNQMGGYRVVLQHREGLDNARIFFNGASIPLSGGTETVLVERSGPRDFVSQVSLDFSEVPPDMRTVSLRAEPRGMTY